jgi:5-formyltetrahydrofolate cyclo-ligase
MEDKATIRTRTLVARRNLHQSARSKANRTIRDAVLARADVRSATTICIYESFPDEVDTHELILLFRRQHKTVVVPPRSVEDVADISSVDLFIVPGVAFDRHGNRLGRGGGYYDRLLTSVRAPVIGLAYQCQIVSGLPRSQYDIPVHTVITEKETLP